MKTFRERADDWASYEQNCDGPIEDTFFAGARALLELARETSHDAEEPEPYWIEILEALIEGREI